LAHTVEEVRILTKASEDAGVYTQMGNQGHSNSSTIFIKEIIQTGLLGQVRDVYSWTNRSGIWWKQSGPIPGHSRVTANIPSTLEWDLWLGIAQSRLYDPGLLPVNWRIYNDFGNGVIGDIGCHMLDSVYWGLDLQAPNEIEASTIMNNCYPFPVSSVVTYKFPCRGGKPPVTLHWYEGGIPPAFPDSLKIANIINEEYRFNGSLLVGEQGLILSDTYGSNTKIYMKDGHSGGRYIKSLNAREDDNACHYGEFFRAIAESRKASSDFSYAGPLTEMVLLGRISQRIRGRLKFDKMEGNFIGNEKASKMLKKEYPEGWILT
jgi:predicted dehydrogenase